jgi:hypothetical protein
MSLGEPKSERSTTAYAAAVQPGLIYWHKRDKFSTFSVESCRNFGNRWKNPHGTNN